MAEDTRGPMYAALKQAGHVIAEPIASNTRAALPRGERTTGQLQGDVRVSVTRTGAGVRMGRKSVPYAGWVEFGGTRREPHATSREYVSSGRYLFPAAASVTPGAVEEYGRALEAVFDSSRVWTNTGSDPGSVHD
jgi:hypothetical protein